MTSITDLAERIKIDNNAIISNQEQSNKSLDSIDKNFHRFFSIQERNSLDRLEDKREASRKKTRVSSGRSILGTAAAAANPANWAKALTPGNIAKGLLGLVGVLTVKPALKLLGASAKTLQNLFDDAAKTQRGLNRFTAKDLQVKMDTAAKAAKLEEARLKNEQKALEKERKAAVAREKALKKEALIAQENRIAQAQRAAEDARLHRLEIEARLDKTKMARTEAGITRAQAIQNKNILKTVGNMPFKAQNIALANQRAILGSMVDVNDFSTGSRPNMPSMLDDIPKAMVSPSSPKRPPIPRVQGMFDSPIRLPSPAQTATMKLLGMPDDLARAGFEAVDTGRGGFRFRPIGPSNTFVAAEEVFKQVDAVRKSPNPKPKITLGTVAKVGVGGLYVVDAALAMAAEVHRAKEEERILKNAELTNSGIAGLITAPLALLDFLINTTASGIEKAGNAVGYQFPDQGTRIDIAGGMSKDIRTDLNSGAEFLNIGQGEANETIVNGVLKTESTIGKMFKNIVGAFTGTSKDSGVLAGYDNMTPEDYRAMSIAPNIDASSATYNYNSGGIVMDAATPTTDNLGGGSAYAFVGGAR